MDPEIPAAPPAGSGPDPDAIPRDPKPAPVPEGVAVPLVETVAPFSDANTTAKAVAVAPPNPILAGWGTG